MLVLSGISLTKLKKNMSSGAVAAPKEDGFKNPWLRCCKVKWVVITPY